MPLSDFHVRRMDGAVELRDLDASLPMTPTDRRDVPAEFVAAAVHDLRSVQMALQLGLYQLRAGLDDQDREGVLALLERQTMGLGRLTDDLLLFSMAGTGRIAVQPDSVELGPLLRDAGAASGTTDVEVETAAGLRVWADPAHVLRMIANLVRNAFWHGAPPVRIRAAAHEDQVEIRVSDAGPGVAPEFVPHLFRRFARAPGAPEGSGLGLSIVAELALLNGGSAGYQPHPPGCPGSSFVVRLPRRPQPADRRVGGVVAYA